MLYLLIILLRKYLMWKKLEPPQAETFYDPLSFLLPSFHKYSEWILAFIKHDVGDVYDYFVNARQISVPHTQFL